MQAIFRKEGNSLDHTPAAAVAAGDILALAVGGPLGAAKLDIAASDLGAVVLDGVFDVVKDASDITAAWTPLYWDADGDPVGGTAGSGAVSTTATDNVFFGWSLEVAGTTTGTVRALKRTASTVTVHHDLSYAITDPGNAGAIPVTSTGSVQIVTAAAETRTIAAPTRVGQELLVCLKTDGGDCVITVSTGINQAGNNTITMNDAGDSIRLNAIQSGANVRWRVVYNDGCTLATV